jgi:hypothetical protein
MIPMLGGLKVERVGRVFGARPGRTGPTDRPGATLAFVGLESFARMAELRAIGFPF